MTDRVEMLLRGRMSEKFIARALREGVCFECIRRSDAREMTLCASALHAARLMGMAEEYGMDLRVVREEGRPLWRKRLRARASVLAGAALCAVLVWMFCARIWRVEAVSLDGMTDAETLRLVERFAAQQGAFPGTLRRLIDREALKSDIQLEWNVFTHVGVRVRGVLLRIEVAEEDGAPQLYDVSDSRDLVALRDAVVAYVEPLSGKAQVKAGDTVRRGQVLIRGEERTDANVVRPIRALGEVLARVWFEAECSLPLRTVIRERTGNQSVSSQIRLGGWSLSLTEGQEYSCQDVEVEYLPVGGLYLPLRVVRTVRWEVLERSVQADETALRAQGEAWALELARAQLPDGAQESACWTECVRGEDALVVRGVIEAQMNIAVDAAGLSAE